MDWLTDNESDCVADWPSGLSDSDDDGDNVAVIALTVASAVLEPSVGDNDSVGVTDAVTEPRTDSVPERDPDPALRDWVILSERLRDPAGLAERVCVPSGEPDAVADADVDNDCDPLLVPVLLTAPTTPTRCDDDRKATIIKNNTTTVF